MAPKRMSQVPSTALVSKSAVRSMIRSSIAQNSELKIAQGGTSGNTSTGGAIAGITDVITQSNTISGRSGDKIIVKSLSIKFQATMNPVSTSDRVRLIVFADTENANALPAVTDVLATAATNSFLNLGNHAAGRFRVLYDQTYQLNTAGAAGMFKTIQVPVRNWPVFYATTTGLGRNNILFLEISDTATNLSTFAISTEIRYTDS